MQEQNQLMFYVKVEVYSFYKYRMMVMEYKLKIFQFYVKDLLQVKLFNLVT